MNHDGEVDINDVTAMISYVLGTSNTEACCPICADVDNTNEVDINDVTAAISYVLTGVWPEN